MKIARVALLGGVLTGLPAAVSGCATQAEIAEARAAQLTADKQECENIGFKQGTDAFGDCVLKLREIRAQQAEAAAINRAALTPLWNDPWYPYRRPYW